jgi:CTP:molybdopterin cytidylyltransferase MocA
MFTFLDRLMTLAEKILTLTEQEKREGMAIVTACESLKEALAKAEAKIAEMVAMIGDIPQLQAEVANLRAELRDANIAADTIADINAAPIVEPIE